jgi:hypothetical protein
MMIKTRKAVRRLRITPGGTASSTRLGATRLYENGCPGSISKTFKLADKSTNANKARQAKMNVRIRGVILFTTSILSINGCVMLN